MSVASEIARLQQAKADIKQAIEDNGITVPSSAKLDTYDDYIAQISAGGSQGANELLVTYVDKVTEQVNGGDVVTSIVYTDASITLSNSEFTYSTIPAADRPRVYSLKFPTSVTAIGTNGLDLQYFPNLVNIEGLENVTTIKYYSFYNTLGLRTVNLPSLNNTSSFVQAFCGSTIIGVDSLGSATGISGSAFSNCKYLKWAVLPSAMRAIDSNAFNECTKLEYVNFAKLTTLTYINAYAFKNCSSLYVGNAGFPTSITAIYNDAFNGCTSLACNLNLPNLQTLDYAAFKGALVYNITNLGQITSLNGTSACGTFSDCSELLTVVLPSTLTSIGVEDFRSCSKLYSINLPNIGEGAFRTCSALTSLSFPNGLVSLGSYAMASTSLATIDLSGTYGNNLSIGTYCFSSIKTAMTVRLPKDVVLGAYAFTLMGGETYDATKAQSLDFVLDLSETTMTSIPTRCFYKSMLTKVTSLGSVTSIAAASTNGVFESSTYLTEVTLSSSLTSLGTRAFYGCTHLTTLTVLATTPPTFGSNALYNTTALTNIYVPSESVTAYQTASGWSAFATKISAIPTS